MDLTAKLLGALKKGLIGSDQRLSEMAAKDLNDAIKTALEDNVYADIIKTPGGLKRITEAVKARVAERGETSVKEVLEGVLNDIKDPAKFKELMTAGLEGEKLQAAKEALAHIEDFTSHVKEYQSERIAFQAEEDAYKALSNAKSAEDVEKVLENLSKAVEQAEEKAERAAETALKFRKDPDATQAAKDLGKLRDAVKQVEGRAEELHDIASSAESGKVAEAIREHMSAWEDVLKEQKTALDETATVLKAEAKELMAFRGPLKDGLKALGLTNFDLAKTIEPEASKLGDVGRTLSTVTKGAEGAVHAEGASWAAKMFTKPVNAEGKEVTKLFSSEAKGALRTGRLAVAGGAVALGAALLMNGRNKDKYPEFDAAAQGRA